MWKSQEIAFDVPRQCLKGKEISNTRKIFEFPNFLQFEGIIYVFGKSALSLKYAFHTRSELEFLSGIENWLIMKIVPVCPDICQSLGAGAQVYRTRGQWQLIVTLGAPWPNSLLEEIFSEGYTDLITEQTFLVSTDQIYLQLLSEAIQMMS